MQKFVPLILITVTLLSASRHAYADTAKKCSIEESQEVPLNPKIGAKLVASACGTPDGIGQVHVKIIKDGEIIQTLASTYDSPAYALFLDSEFDIDTDGIPDLKIATGKGRGGEGMHYWRFDPDSEKYADLGEAPNLSHCKSSSSKVLFSLISSSGEMQSIRYNYVFDQGKLSLKSGIGFIPLASSENYRLVELVPNRGGSLTLSNKSIEIDAGSVESYMSDSCLCPGFMSTRTKGTEGINLP